MSIKRRQAVAGLFYDALTAYDDFDIFVQRLRELKIGWVTAGLQRGALIEDFPEGMSMRDRQLTGIRFAGNVETMIHGAVIRKHPNVSGQPHTWEQMAHAAIVDVGEWDAAGVRRVTFVGLTGLWAGIILRGGTRHVAGNKLMRPFRKMTSYRELNGHVFECHISDEGRVQRAVQTPRTKAYNSALRKKRLEKRGELCKGGCLGCRRKLLAGVNDAGDLYSVCCPYTGRFDNVDDGAGSGGAAGDRARAVDDDAGAAAVAAGHDGGVLQPEGSLPQVRS